MSKFSPVIAAEKRVSEITLRVISLSIILTVVLAMSNAYLALKIGILASASIPAAIISMAILRFARNASILENNLVQTAASAGEAIAGGIVYTAPALILIHFWDRFNYWENVAIALTGGMLGVLFSIPLRRVLVNNKQLHFPEGRAIAEVLIAGHAQKIGFSDIFKGGIFGAVLELMQTGLHIVSQQAQFWVGASKTVWGFGLGFSAPMFGVGYLVGFRVGLSLFIGAVLCWLVGIPISGWVAIDATVTDPASAAQQLWADSLRYVGVGAMLTAGLVTLGGLFTPLVASMKEAWAAFNSSQTSTCTVRTDFDMPLGYVLLGLALFSAALVALFYWQLPVQQLQLAESWTWAVILSCVIYALIVGFVFSAITGYFSGLVGVTASPGSAIIIAGLLLAAIGLRFVLESADIGDIAASKLSAAAITIFLGAIITGAAAIANDNIQDLKVGHILGATPWKQQLMLMLGVLVAAITIPIVMQLLFGVYGIGDVLPRPGMDISKALPAPPAAMMAAVTQGVFDYDLPWHFMGIGAVVVAVFFVINHAFLSHMKRLSLLGVAMGIYLPLATSMPLFFGGLVAFLAKRQLVKQRFPADETQSRYRRAILIACGLVSGAAVMNILLAIPFIVVGSPDVLAIMPANLQYVADVLGIAAGGFICIWLYRAVVK